MRIQLEENLKRKTRTANNVGDILTARKNIADRVIRYKKHLQGKNRQAA